MVPEACDTRLDLHRIQLKGNDHTYWGTQHAIHLDAWYQWRLRVRDGPAIAVEASSYPVMNTSDVNRDTRSHGYQPAGVDRSMMTSMLQEVDDMASVVIQEPPSSPSQMALFAKKVQTIIWRCMVSINGTLGCTPSQHDIQQTFPVQPSCHRPQEHVPDRGARGVKRGARRHLGCGAGGGRPPVPPAPERHEHVDPGHVEVERDASPARFRIFWVSGTPSSGDSQFIYTASAYMQASSSDEEERADDMDGLQRYGFGHLVGKKTTRFTPSDWL
ncbi:hypothetical protein M9H77_11964 [Catharanthus roseus]|uniref:Uncharacterized protein n=1 Tax=Catharanthus roseus TaxID=4058 RepID=A0ACC0BG05_CATRO|nr:hypothetical protein M9H77_11964 [Catharanthus roseus]